MKTEIVFIIINKQLVLISNKINIRISDIAI